jgi:class 3 adenylate cyclase
MEPQVGEKAPESAPSRTGAAASFEDRGEHTLKGVGEPMRVWDVVGTNTDN